MRKESLFRELGQLAFLVPIASVRLSATLAAAPTISRSSTLQAQHGALQRLTDANTIVDHFLSAAEQRLESSLFKTQ